MSGLKRNGSLPPPQPKSPPHYPDLYGKRRELARVQMLEREIGFLQEELKSVERIPPASRSCKEVTDFVIGNVDPLIPTIKKTRRSCRFWKWLCGVCCCFNFSWSCCCSCSWDLETPRCSDCMMCDSCSVNLCQNCCIKPKCQCLRSGNAAAACPSCPACSCTRCTCYPQCPKLNICSCCHKSCCFPCYYCM